MPRLLLAVVVLGLALPGPAAAAVPVLVVDGRGFGHGVGMAQDGAYWMGRAGAGTDAILAQFFPGTSPARAKGEVRVPVLDAGAAPSSAVLELPTGGLVRDAPPDQPARQVDLRVAPGARVTITWDGQRYRVTAPGAGAQASSGRPARTGIAVADLAGATARAAGPGTDPRPAQAGPLPTAPASSTTTTTTTAPSPEPPVSPSPSSTTTTAPPPSPTTAPPGPAPGPSSPHPIWSIPDRGGTIAVPGREGRRYRGAIEATAGSGDLRFVNQLDVEVYLKGMGEVRDPTWPPASLRAQAVAARTYALRAMSFGGEICDTQRCQVYLGADAEYAVMAKAVDDTRGQVLAYGRTLASAVYSANGGGYSASREEGFGQSGEGYPYLRAAPYPTGDPRPWRVEVALVDAASRLGYRGQLTAVEVTATGPSGRAQVVRLDGSAGSQERTGLAVADALRLPSTLFSTALGTAEAPPPPPQGESILQTPPELLSPPPLGAGPDRHIPDISVVVEPPAGPGPGPAGGRVGGLALWAAVWLFLSGAAAAASAWPSRGGSGRPGRGSRP